MSWWANLQLTARGQIPRGDADRKTFFADDPPHILSSEQLFCFVRPTPAAPFWGFLEIGNPEYNSYGHSRSKTPLPRAGGWDLRLGGGRNSQDAHKSSICKPTWRQPRGKSMVYLVNSHANATSSRWHLWEIDLRFATGLPPGWIQVNITSGSRRVRDPPRPLFAWASSLTCFLRRRSTERHVAVKIASSSSSSASDADGSAVRNPTWEHDVQATAEAAWCDRTGTRCRMRLDKTHPVESQHTPTLFGRAGDARPRNRSSDRRTAPARSGSPSA